MKRVSIVIPYIMGPDNGMELRFALRSIENNFAHDNYEIVVIGDKPDWLTNVVHVPFSRISDRSFRAFEDQIMKLYVAITECNLSNDFIWTYDDVFFTRKIELADIKMLKAARKIETLAEVDSYPGGTNWKSCIKQALDDTGGTYVFETHLPRWYNKKKMLALFDRFHMLTRPTVIATLYYNYYLENNVPLLLNDNTDHIRFMLRSMFSVEKLEKIMRRSNFTNNSPATWTPVLKDVLMKMFPLCSKYEAGRH